MRGSEPVRGTYTYNGFEQLISRVITNSGTANGTVNTVHDLWGNVIAELDATGATVREYIWLPEAEIAPTRQSRAQVDIPLAVVDAVNTTPVILNVHADHLGRPVKMTNSAKASVWDVTYTPWGAPHTLTGAQTLNERFPGQWFQLESGLHYNWHRHVACPGPHRRAMRDDPGIRHSGATPSPTRSASSMGRGCMGMRRVIRRSSSIKMVDNC